MSAAKFFDVHAANGSAIAKQALDRIGELYRVEKTITGLPSEQRRAERQKRSSPIAEALRSWAEATLPKLSRKSELAKALRYRRSRWKALLRCLDDGRVCLTKNAAERAMRGIAMRRPLCPPCSSLWKHWKLVCRRDATRGICSRDRGKDPLGLQVGGPDLIGSRRHDLLGGKDAVCDQPPAAMMSNPERRSGLGHRGHSPVFSAER